jgi:RNA polymerase sigma-70 factor (ECF subfamily)
MARTLDEEMVPARLPEMDVGAVYDAHGEHVWRSLHRLGVASADLPDLTQEVFVVVHRRRADFDAAQSIRGWLWGICVGLARNYKKRAFRHTERLVDAPEGIGGGDAEGDLDTRRRGERGRRALSELDPERRAVFVMFEVEGMSGRAIAEALDLPIGTVHSRLHAARGELAKALGEEEEV